MFCNDVHASPVYYKGRIICSLELKPFITFSGYKTKLVNLLNYNVLFKHINEYKASFKDE